VGTCCWELSTQSGLCSRSATEADSTLSGKTCKSLWSWPGHRATSAVNVPWVICPGVVNALACGRRVAVLENASKKSLAEEYALTRLLVRARHYDEERRAPQGYGAGGIPRGGQANTARRQDVGEDKPLRSTLIQAVLSCSPRTRSPPDQEVRRPLSPWQAGRARPTRELKLHNKLCSAGGWSNVQALLSCRRGEVSERPQYFALREVLLSLMYLATDYVHPTPRGGRCCISAFTSPKKSATPS
jgi:hypothetical protein